MKILQSYVFAAFETENTSYEILDFEVTDTIKCHNFTIPDDKVCELNRTDNIFHIRLTAIPSDFIIVRVPSNLSVATVFIDDSREPECRKLKPKNLCYFPIRKPTF